MTTGGKAIYIVDDDPSVRDALAVVFQLEGYDVETFETGDAFLAAAGKRAPACVLLDVHMPDGGGVEVIRRAAEAAAADPEASPAPRFLALSVSDDPEDVVSVIRAGARGYVTKSISGPDLIDAIGRVDQGDAVFSPQLAGFVLDAFAGATAPEEDNELDLLTPREQEVLRLIARGYMYKEIARRLGISVKTVEAHTSSTLRKLQLSSRHELARWATERDLLD